MHDAADAGVGRRFQDRERPVRVRGVGRERLLDRTQHGLVRGLVEHDLAALDGPARGRLVGDRALDQCRPLGCTFAAKPVLRVVEHDDLVAAGDERVDEVRSDETRATRDQDSHRAGG